MNKKEKKAFILKKTIQKKISTKKRIFKGRGKKDNTCLLLTFIEKKDYRLKNRRKKNFFVRVIIF